MIRRSIHANFNASVFIVIVVACVIGIIIYSVYVYFYLVSNRLGYIYVPALTA